MPFETARDATSEANRVVLPALAVLSAVVVGWGPILTNEGPVHVAFAHLMGKDPGALRQYDVYAPGNHQINNAIGEVFLNAMMRVTSPTTAEAILQALCLVSPVAAGAFCIALLHRLGRSWEHVAGGVALAVVAERDVLSRSLQFLTVGLAVPADRRGPFPVFEHITLAAAGLMTLAMIAAFVVHPSGFIAAFVFAAFLSPVGHRRQILNLSPR
jgi:hypothetical protein